jgi:hypothetical protein
MKKIAGLLGLALLSACSSNSKSDTTVDEKTITFNNFEGGPGWSNDPYRNNIDLFDKGRAHSGQYAIKVDQNNEFGMTFDMPLGKVSPAKFKKIRLEGWVFMPSERATGVLGMQIINHESNQQTFGDAIVMRDAVKEYNKWVHVSKDIVLPDDITPAQHLRMALWRADATDVLLADDVKLSILE